MERMKAGLQELQSKGMPLGAKVGHRGISLVVTHQSIFSPHPPSVAPSAAASLTLYLLLPGPPLQEACNLLWALMRLQPHPPATAGGSKRAASPKYAAAAGPGSALPLLLAALLPNAAAEPLGAAHVGSICEALGPHDLKNAFWAVGIAAAVRPKAAVTAFTGRLRAELQREGGSGIRGGGDEAESLEGDTAIDWEQQGRGRGRAEEEGASAGPRSAAIWDLLPGLVLQLSRLPASAFRREDLAALHRADLVLRSARGEAEATLLAAATAGRWGGGREAAAVSARGRHKTDGSVDEDGGATPVGGAHCSYDATGSRLGSALTASAAAAAHTIIAEGGCAQPVDIWPHGLSEDPPHSQQDSGGSSSRFGAVSLIQGRPVIDVSHFTRCSGGPDAGGGGSASGRQQLPWWEDPSASLLPEYLSAAAAAAARELASEQHSAAGATTKGGGRPPGTVWLHEVAMVSRGR